MANYLEVPDFDDLFKTVKDPLIVNDIPYGTTEERDNFINIILAVHNYDILSSTQEWENVADKKSSNLIINTEHDAVELKTWVAIPEGVLGFISPNIYYILTKNLNSRGYNLIDWIINPRSIVPLNLTKDTRRRLDYLVSIKWVRGINYFITNYDVFLEILPILLKGKKPYIIDPLIEYLRDRRDISFPKVLPIPTQNMLVVLGNGNSKKADKNSISAGVDAARTIADINRQRNRPLTIPQLESKVGIVSRALVEFCVKTIRATCCTKRGWIRGQIGSSRAEPSMRAVITSLSDKHDHREVHIPWGQAVELLKVQLISKLIKRGYPFLKAFNLVESSGNQFHPLINELFIELINESPIDKYIGVYTVNGKNNLDEEWDIFYSKILTSHRPNDVGVYPTITICRQLVSDLIIFGESDLNSSPTLAGVLTLIDLWGLEVVACLLHEIKGDFDQFNTGVFHKPLFGIPCILQRNPSLNRLSAQYFGISLVKTDVMDRTISKSVLTIRGSNSDFDGDEENLHPPQGEKVVTAIKYLQSHYGIHSLDHLGELSKVIDLPEVTVSILANWVNRGIIK